MLTGRELKSHEALLAINAAVAGRLLGGGFEGGQDVSRVLQSQAKLLPIVGPSSVVRPFIQFRHYRGPARTGQSQRRRRNVQVADGDRQSICKPEQLRENILVGCRALGLQFRE